MNHDTCTRHRKYYLTCDQFDALQERSGGVCEMCGAAPFKMLYIDHDHGRGRYAVRGLLCARCNTQLVRKFKPPPSAAQYLSRPFYREVGLPTHGGARPYIQCTTALSPELYARVQQAIRDHGIVSYVEFARMAMEMLAQQLDADAAWVDARARKDTP